MAILYTAHASATGGRTGNAKSDDGRLEVTLSTPKELGGDGGAGTNPEQMFAAGYSACFLGAMKFVAGQQKLKLSEETQVAADVGIGPRDDGTGFGIAVTLNITIPGLDKADAQALVEKAHVVCPYSHATRGNIPVTLNVK
ncbi:organic hydroperoxide resistance protein [Stappia indica]|uniref:Peroxiredoxin, Ohr subfamily n=1 Tax=Stappia indica TaxID=538381 RepID=A0A285S3X7_9HYPH|nr:organic hydroperoxide resistance protein [Stappia indica]MCC4244592.1 organic hydroperoxide resistance protein [Stappia indica]SOB99624.1 peroxiredoxin, Ohr subfamily [Stappia indica]